MLRGKQANQLGSGSERVVTFKLYTVKQESNL